MSDNIFYKISWKTVRNGYKSTFTYYCDNSTMNTRGELHTFIIFSFPSDDQLII